MAAIKLNAITNAKLIRLLVDGEMTPKELSEHSGLSYLTTLHYLRSLHKEGLVHITRFDADDRGRHLAKVWTFGEGKDAKRPRRAKRVRKTAVFKAQLDAYRVLTGFPMQAAA